MKLSLFDDKKCASLTDNTQGQEYACKNDVVKVDLMSLDFSLKLKSEQPCISTESSICDRFGLRLRSLRQASGYTQVELADYLGIDRSFISDLERGKKNISIGYLETIAQGFKLSVSDLLQDL